MEKDYYGTKRITAWPQSKEGKPGYGVKYPDGYVSWSPAEAFEAAYQPLDAMSFGHALTALKAGYKVARVGWAGYVVLMPEMALGSLNNQSADQHVNDRTARFVGESTPLDVAPYLALFTLPYGWQPGWLASQADMLANDWTIVE